jgi:predicted ester cyclase
LNRYIKEVWHNANPRAIDEFLAPNYKRHRTPTSSPLTREEQKSLIEAFRVVFPDVEITLEDLIAEADKIAFRSTMRATDQGELMGIAATGKKVVFGLLDVYRIEDGKIVEQWGGPNMFDLLTQLGAKFSTET